MIRCIVENRLATPDEISEATPVSVLASWRSVWKDRNEDTAYVTTWKRIQDKLTVHVGENGEEFLCFKIKNNSSNQFVSCSSQWQDIVMSFHSGDDDSKHLGLKETIERIKQVWTVGAKFYGIPESYIRVCVAACPVCSDLDACGGGRSKRRRFEYTESFDVPAKEVPNKLQQLAAKHKVVLCIRQKYIRYKPFMEEVKDYACHRAGEPASSSKKSRSFKREPYASKRCGCGFRIRAIVPILNYNEKDKTFVYQEEGMAVFKLYAVHTGHQPGPLDGNARIMHRVLGHKGGLLMEQDMVYGVTDEAENECFAFIEKDDMRCSVLQQVKELKNEVRLLEGKLTKIPSELLGSVSRELFDLLNKVRSVGAYESNSEGLLSEKLQPDDVLVGENDIAEWSHHQMIYGDDKDTNLIEDDDDSFGQTLGDVASWDQIRANLRNEKDLLGYACKAENWLKCGGIDAKTILNDENSKLIKPVRDDETMETDSLVGLQVDSFYPENPKWYESPCGLDCHTPTDGGIIGARH
ncbi:hypothetical protein HanRHA438_Chr06g0254271 [Helianthus annuus]|uniref:Uncharacterized protein n=1 Tax=Helianthus annuus TaxID=4232 RepID=A0A251UFX6_HELAN|nr:hypothetical protein HanXRQr2_Chr06g0245161 [Helianthus annuus]KAJ0559517.1 hypothetical protein HanHA300_Chr06g0201181 [Helianthus annuus]KAJ0565522.1 hypothetical protein HanIR_Chr06g0263491 [Helianthus annuus]KAJ0572488.1 hypothetical protein HanHA89_Chr06g0216221 [Helianthus annuus]KAJ0736927.1 hypothetical protein HanLR1_Chr06g0201231 [Helianthus annuus]